MSNQVNSYRARWVIPVVGPPVANGIVVVQGERIVGVHRSPRADTVDLGDAAIVPGLVNCHTHLEFSGLTPPAGADGAVHRLGSPRGGISKMPVYSESFFPGGRKWPKGGCWSLAFRRQGAG